MTEAATTPLPYPIGRQAPRPELQPAIERAAKGLTLAFGETATDTDVTVQPGDLLKFVTAIRDDPELSFDLLRNISGVDNEAEGMALKYALYSFKHGHSIQVTVPTSAGHPHVPSLTGLYAAADWHELETWDLMGVKFVGHPHLRRILLPEDWVGFPLRKDYVFPDEYHGISCK